MSLRKTFAVVSGNGGGAGVNMTPFGLPLAEHASGAPTGNNA